MDEDTGTPELFMFLASTVHDMKNSISVVSGMLESLLAAGPRQPGASDVAAAADPAFARMAHMLYQTKRLNDNLIQLLALYKQVGKPGYPFDPQPQLLAQIVEQVVAHEQVLLNASEITLQTGFPPGLMWHLDEDLIVGVLGHAINNAVRYTADTIRLALRQDGELLEIRVEDNGAGFSEALIASGAAAMRGSATTIDFSTNSTGLGLYFSSEVAKMHQHRGQRGSIELHNGGTLGGGCFILRLP